MAEIDIPMQVLSPNGTVPEFYTSSTTVALNTTDDFVTPNDENGFLLVRSGSTNTVLTIDTPGTVEGVAISDVTIAVNRNTEKLIGLRGVYGRFIKVRFSNVSGVRYGVFRT